MSSWRDSICENTFETSHVHFIHENFSVLITTPLDQISSKFVEKRDLPNHGQTCGHRFADVIWWIFNPILIVYTAGKFQRSLQHVGQTSSEKSVILGGRDSARCVPPRKGFPHGSRRKNSVGWFLKKKFHGRPYYVFRQPESFVKRLMFAITWDFCISRPVLKKKHQKKIHTKKHPCWLWRTASWDRGIAARPGSPRAPSPRALLQWTLELKSYIYTYRQTKEK